MTRFGLVALVLVGICTAETATSSDLANEADINQGLVMIAAADKIRRECGTISGRLFKAQSFANQLKDVARARGYTEAQIDAYLDSKSERAKVRQKRNVYFESQGASNLDPQSLCSLGYTEIARNSQIGALLKAR